MKRYLLLFLLTASFSELHAQTRDSVITHANSLFEAGKYNEAITLLQDSSKTYANDTVYYTLSNLVLGKAFLMLENFEDAENHILSALNIYELYFGKNSEQYCRWFPLLIKVYDLSYNYERLVDSYLVYLDVLEHVYGKDDAEYSSALNVLGYLYLQLSQYDLAEKYLLQALELREMNLGKEHRDCITTYNNLGLLYFNLADYEKAHTVFDDIKNIYTNRGDTVSQQYAQIASQLGVLNMHLGNNEMAEKYLLDAKQILENNGNTNTIYYTTILGKLGEFYMAKGKYSESEKYLLSAKDMYEQLGGDKRNTNYSTLIADLATMYNSAGKYEKAEQYFLETLTIMEKTIGKEHAWYALTINNLGTMYYYTGNSVKAEDKFIEAKNICEKIFGTNHPEYARALGNLGVLYTQTEKYQLAEKYLLQSKTIYDNTNPKAPQYAMLLNDIGLLYNQMGDIDRTWEYFIKSNNLMYELYSESPDYALSLINLGGKYNDAGDDTTAIKYINYAIAIIQKNIGSLEHPYAIMAFNNAGKIRTQQGLYEKAEQDLLIADSLYIKVFGKDYPERILTLNNLAYLYITQNNYDLALRYILEAKNLVDSNNNQSYSHTTLENLCFIYWLSEKYNSAIPYLQEWDALTKQTISQQFSFMSTKQRYEYWTFKSNGAALEYFTKLLLSTFPTPATQSIAFNNALFSKGLLLRSSNEIRDAILGSGNQELIGQFESLGALRQQITALQTKADTTMTAYIESLETRADSLDKAITAASSAYREQKADMNLEWQDVQNSLADNEIAIEFIDYQKFNKEWTDTTLYAALIVRKNSENPVFVPLFEKSQLDSLLNDNTPALDKRISKLYNGGNPRFFSGQKLYRLVWQPLEKYLQDIETVYYSPSGVLNQIAFSAIPADSVCLADKYRLRLVSSTREVVREKKRQGAFLPVSQAVEYGGIQYDTDSVALVQSAQRYKTAEPTYYASRSLPQDSTRSGWQFLHGAQAEVTEVENILQKHKVPNIKFMGVSANEESFKALSGNSPALLHVATHGFFLQDEKEIRQTGFMQMLGGQENRAVSNPLLRSGLLFAGANRAWTNENVIQGIEDGVLTAEEISNLNLSGTKLVVLSACETGLGEVQNSEGVFGLQRAFKLAGVETLVMSLWKVDDAATKDFMITFYENLMAGKSKQEAFKTAQRAVREKYVSPYYWAAFVMMD